MAVTIQPLSVQNSQELHVPTKDDILDAETFRGEEVISDRIYHTLTADITLDKHRIAKATSILIERLVEKDVIREEEIDDLLFQVVT
jgi:hypothetical protein